MEITLSTRQARVPVTVVHVNGNIDSLTYEAFLAEVEGLIEAGSRHLLIDLKDVPLLSSAGLRALNSVFLRLRQLATDVSDEQMRQGIHAGTYRSPHLKLARPSNATKLALETSGFSMFLDILGDVDAGVAAF
ncbi:MAG TPA: STAS domain-containing protein [Anaerolineales bacterium]|nr:STAS domain-containing protein [Anaerolineales bacterium]